MNSSLTAEHADSHTRTDSTETHLPYLPSFVKQGVHDTLLADSEACRKIAAIVLPSFHLSEYEFVRSSVCAFILVIVHT